MPNVKKIVRWLLLVNVLIYIISGLGITQSRIIETLTLGILTKPLSFKIHNQLVFLISLLILLFFHIVLTVGKKR